MLGECQKYGFRDQCGVRLEKSGFGLASPLARLSLLEAAPALFRLWRPSPSGYILDEQTDQNRDPRPAPPRPATSLVDLPSAADLRRGCLMLEPDPRVSTAAF